MISHGRLRVLVCAPASAPTGTAANTGVANFGTGYRCAEWLTTSAEGRGRGPREVPARGWRDILARTIKEAKADGLPLLAAGVAFFFLLALAPALTALTGVYGLVADPSDAAGHVQRPAGRRTPGGPRPGGAAARDRRRARPPRRAARGVLGTVLALWSASAGVQHLVQAINTAYDEDETRGFIKVRGLALLLSIGAIVFLAVAVGVIAAAGGRSPTPPWASPPASPSASSAGPPLAVAMVVALSVLYRMGGRPRRPKWRWVTIGSITATVLWLVGSGLFSLYAARFGKYEETYGALAAVVVVMLWLYLTAYAIILGAELNAESERQTSADTTTGRHRPLGDRDAEAADTVGPTAEEVSEGVPAHADVSDRANGS